MNKRYVMWCGIIISLGFGCTKPYNPSVTAAPNNYLVVEGNINTGTDSTTILLSRTTNISSGITSAPELNATVTIQDSQNGSYSLTNAGNGAYKSGLITLDQTRNYRLNITTSDGKNYTSDYVPAVNSPPIDSIGFTIKSDGLQIYVNTHDPNNHTHYYRWDYHETWEFHAEYSSNYESNGDTILPRQISRQIYKCWTNDISTDIKLGSSAKLTQDVIYQNPLVFIPSTSEKLEERYSILLKQYGMTTDGYNYYNLLKKNTEQLGSIFDAQPSSLSGNVHSTTDPGLIVIGYVTAGTVQQKRVYFNNLQFPSSWKATYPYDCAQDTTLYNDPHSLPPGQNTTLQLVPLPNALVITSAVTQMGHIIGYLYSYHDCADCSIRGSTTAPSFWIAGPYD